MIEINFFYFLVFFLSLIQSFVGVGVLVLGTPILLILDFKLFDIMITLLPISILTSIISILFIKKKQKVFFYDDTLKYFLIICLPAMFVGLKIVNNFGNLINFNILVGLVILFSLIIKLKFQKIEIGNKVIMISNNLKSKINNIGVPRTSTPTPTKDCIKDKKKTKK